MNVMNELLMSWLNIKNNYNIVLSTRNAHLDTLKAKLEHLGYDVGLLIGKEKKAVRKEILDDFKRR